MKKTIGNIEAEEIKQTNAVIAKLGTSGDFGSFECPKCHEEIEIKTKDGVQRYYFCAYCGQKVEVKALKEKEATFILEKRDNFGLAVISKEGKESLLIEAYEGKTPLDDFIENLDYGDKVILTLVVM